MKKIPVLLAILILASGTAWSEESIVPNRFRPGDVVTADSLNESFDALSQYHSRITTAQLIGEWNCVAVAPLPDESMFPYAVTNGWNLSATGLTLKKSVKLIFRNSNGTVLSSDVFNPFSPLVARPQIAPNFQKAFEIAAGGLYFENEVYVSGLAAHYQREIVRYDVTRTARDEFLFAPQDYGSQATLSCKATQSAPVNPTGLTVTSEASSVQISWVDNSSNEDTFIVLRKKEGESNFSQATTTVSETSLCSETLPVGTYYYQVKARNTFGDSVGSNVVRVKVGS